MAELDENEGSPFDPDNAAGLSLIVQMRTYDVLLAILNKLDPEAADVIYDAHSMGKIVSALPSYIPADADED